ncbi:MAG: molecular chaperone DnaJ [Alphaproteobacteria bacterium]|nr:molecular chaperone DnaJ [Alphaproteobacteria bacterium]
MVKFRATETFQLHRRPRQAEALHAPHAAGLRSCDAPGCAGEGQFRAPQARDRLTQYYWFCLDHVRSYNAAWNYYAGMNEKEIEALNRADVTWWRPTWPLGGFGGHGTGLDPNRFRRENLKDGFGFFMDDTERPEPRRRPTARVAKAEEEAFQIMDLPTDTPWVQIKARYKALVKLHHPDANGGDRDAEERLKTINQAYTTLKKSISS